jgi:3-polyprenyl-4-hydroxybenzoate decarboxylase
VCDHDVDVTNLDHMLWAMITRTDPAESIQFIRGSWDSSADPAIPPERRKAGNITHSVALINACSRSTGRTTFRLPTRQARRSRARRACLSPGNLLSEQESIDL